MRKVIPIFLIIFLLCLAAYSQENDVDTSLFKKALAGEFWEAMDDTSKFAFLMGLSQGITYDAIINHRDDMNFVKTYLNEILPEVHPLVVMDYFDGFYSRAENKNIPIFSVWDFYILNYTGAMTKEESEEMLSAFRKEFNITKKDKCPECGAATKELPVIYGYPSREMFEMQEKGEIVLGGCVVDLDPGYRKYKCTECDWKKRVS